MLWVGNVQLQVQVGIQNVNPAAGNKGIYNKDWWPNALNLKMLSQHSNKVDPLGVEFDYKKEFAKLDYEALKRPYFSYD